MSLLEIKCPHCKSSIWIDPSSGAIVEHKVPDQKKVDLTDFLKSQKNRSTDLEDKFKKAKEEQTKRKEELEKEFLRAKEHPEDFQGEVDSPFKWD
jgi:hypothetical protein